MDDMQSLIYLGAIVAAVAVGFIFAVWLSIKGIRDSERDWAAREAQSAHEPVLAGVGEHQSH